MRRPSSLLVLLGAILAVAGCHALEDRFVFQPRPAPNRPLPPSQSLLQDVELRLRDGTAIHARWCPHPGSQVALLYCHGNAGNLEGRARAVRELWEALGASVFIFDYPGFGQSEGQPSEAGCYAAADAAYDWLVGRQGVPPDRLVLYGESLGGGVAVDLASRRPHRALVLVRTFTSVPDVAQEHFGWLPVRWLMRNRFDSLAKIGRCRQPIFIAQATDDQLVPFEHGKQLRDAAGERATFFALEKCGHNGPLPPELYAALSRFLAALAGPPINGSQPGPRESPPACEPP
jgi:fermentation-respiration switch protein FrsA (DUF1100 family)